jgi:Putative beta-lactamase-inhibitor-like, PepSY-like
MKKLALIAICAVLICFTVNAQKATVAKIATKTEKATDAKVPAVLKAAFAKQFPKATDVKWEKEGGDWEVALKNNGKEMTVAMDKKGKVTETEVSIQVAELPGAALKYIATKFKGKPILSVDKITAGTKVSFEVVVQKGKAMMFDENGKYLKTGND